MRPEDMANPADCRSRKRGKRPPRAALSEKTDFTLESLRSILKKSVLRRGLAMPSDAELAELARILNGWKTYYVIAQNSRDVVDLKKRARDAIDTLAGILPRLQEINDRFAANAEHDGAPAEFRAILNAQQSEIETALRFVTAAGRFSSFAEQFHEVLKSWRWLANALTSNFYNAMGPANPNLRRGIGHTGPLARFIAAVAPLITGQMSSVGSIATQLKNMKSAQLKADKADANVR